MHKGWVSRRIAVGRFHVNLIHHADNRWADSVRAEQRLYIERDALGTWLEVHHGLWFLGFGVDSVRERLHSQALAALAKTVTSSPSASTSHNRRPGRERKLFAWFR